MMFKKEKLFIHFKRSVPIVGILILVYLILSIGANKIVYTFLKLSPFYVILSLSLTLPRILIRNLAWQIVLKKQSINISYVKSLKIFLIAYFYATTTPGYIGQLMRIPYLKEVTDEPLGKLFVNTFIETALHTLSLYIMMIISAFLIVDQYPPAPIYAGIFITAVFIIYSFFVKKERGERVFHALIKFIIPKKLKLYSTKFTDTFYTDFPKLKDLIVPFILGIPEWIFIYTQIYLVALSLDININYFVFILLYPIANIIAFIPITSAGLGTREATVVLLLSFFGIEPEKAIVVSLAGHIITDVLTGMYGFIISIFEARISKIDRKKLKKSTGEI